MSVGRTYYWIHRAGENRYLRSSNARKIARIAHTLPHGEIGVFLDTGSPTKHMVIVERGRTIRETARALAATH